MFGKKIVISFVFIACCVLHLSAQKSISSSLLLSRPKGGEPIKETVTIPISNTQKVDATTKVDDVATEVDVAVENQTVDTIKNLVVPINGDNISLENFTMPEYSIQGAKVKDIYVDNSTIGTLTIESTTTQYVTITNVAITKLYIRRCTIEDIYIENSMIGEIIIEKSEVSEFSTEQCLIKSQIITKYKKE